MGVLLSARAVTTWWSDLLPTLLLYRVFFPFLLLFFFVTGLPAGPTSCSLRHRFVCRWPVPCIGHSIDWSFVPPFFVISDWKLVWSIDRTLSLNRFRCRSRKNDCPIVDRLCNRFNARASSECCRFFSLFLSRFTQEKLSTVDVFSIQVPSLALATGPTPLGGASMQSATNDHQFT